MQKDARLPIPAPPPMEGELIFEPTGFCKRHSRKLRTVLIVGLPKIYCPDCEVEKSEGDILQLFFVRF